MKKVSIKPGCIACGTCAFIAPNIFEVTDKSRVKQTADLVTHQDAINKAVRSCPVSVIQFHEENGE